ncbi:MAG: hypothetical protein Q4G63_02180 [Bacteroidia bacterium]|nr:hypothetical protein [Bacteroidia bacterium]
MQVRKNALQTQKQIATPTPHPSNKTKTTRIFNIYSELPTGTIQYKAFLMANSKVKVS